MFFSALFKLIVIAVYLVTAFFFADDTFFFTESRRIGKNGFGFFVCLSNYLFGVLLISDNLADYIHRNTTFQ